MRDGLYTTRKRGRSIALALATSFLVHLAGLSSWSLLDSPKPVPPPATVPAKALSLTLNSEVLHEPPAPELAAQVPQPKPTARPSATRKKAPSKSPPAQPRTESPRRTLSPIEELVRKRPDARPPPDPRSLFRADPSAVSKIIPMAPLPSSDSSPVPSKTGRRLFAGWRDRNERFSQSLLGSAVTVRPGNHAVVQPSPGYREYIHHIHHKIHRHWANGFLIELDLRRSTTDPLSNPSLNTELEFIIDAADGEVESVNIVRSSGQALFDAEAISVAHLVGPHPSPPPELVSPNGRIYIHWNFWRNQRQCGVFGVSVFRLNADLLSQPG
jgi:TonB family protein